MCVCCLSELDSSARYIYIYIYIYIERERERERDECSSACSFVLSSTRLIYHMNHAAAVAKTSRTEKNKFTQKHTNTQMCPYNY